MKSEEILRKIVFGHTGKPEIQSRICKVKAVNGSCCDVKDVMSDGELKNVRLVAMGTMGMVITPTVGSDVIVTMLSNTDSYVSMFSKIDKVSYKDEKGCEVVIEEGKICMKNKKAQLWQELNNLLTALQSAIIATPAGSGAFDAGTVQKIVQVQTNLKKLLC